MNPTSKKSPDTVTNAGWLNWLPGIAGLLATILIGSYFFTFQKLPTNESPAAWGTFGDYMGGLLNPLISLFTLIVAMKVWGLQKTELLETRKAVEEQGKTAEQQRREQRFFDFLNIYRSTVDSVQFEMESKAGSVIALQGKRAFQLLTTDQHGNPFRELSFYFSSGQWNSFLIDRDLRGRESELWEVASPVLDHYFRAIFSILREAEPTLKEEHWRYTKLLRAQLSRDEINLLAMNLLLDEEGKKMRPLVERYGMLKHMPANTLRKLAERDLPPYSFGRKWTEKHILTPREESHAD